MIPGATIALGILWYKQGGIDALLEVKTAPVKSALIPETLMNQLRECLSQPQGFNSYGQIQEWLTQECQVVVAYKTVHKIVPYKLNAKLKVPRPRSAKAKPEVQATLKKNFRK